MNIDLHPAIKAIMFDPNRKLHNVTLLEVNDGGLFKIRCTGLGNDFETNIEDGADYSVSLVGKTGYLNHVYYQTGDTHKSQFVFHPYVEPSLRRAPVFDSVSQLGAVSLGWTCDAHPEGFLADPRIVPGLNGDWIASVPTEVIIQAPYEFVQICEEVGTTSERVLRGFIADLCEIQNFTANPRADGYSSNGSDERRYASEYFERAYSVCREAAMAFLQRQQERNAIAEEEEVIAADLWDLRQEFIDNGGLAEDFFKSVETLVKQGSKR